MYKQQAAAVALAAASSGRVMYPSLQEQQCSGAQRMRQHAPRGLRLGAGGSAGPPLDGRAAAGGQPAWREEENRGMQNTNTQRGLVEGRTRLLVTVTVAVSVRVRGPEIPLREGPATINPAPTSFFPRSFENHKSCHARFTTQKTAVRQVYRRASMVRGMCSAMADYSTVLHTQRRTYMIPQVQTVRSVTYQVYPGSGEYVII